MNLLNQMKPIKLIEDFLFKKRKQKSLQMSPLTLALAACGGVSENSSNSSSSTSPSLKILALHGGGETPASFKGQDGVVSLMNNLSEFEFVFADAPLNNVWMQNPPSGKGQPTTDPNWAGDSIAYLDDLVSQQGPFVGILGYSQGAAFIPVYLANTSSKFDIALMYNGYLPSTHQGLMETINSVAPLQIPAMIFSGEYDYGFNAMAQDLANTFTNPHYIRSLVAGHHLPLEGDPVFSQILNFIITNTSSSASTFLGSMSVEDAVNVESSVDDKPNFLTLKEPPHEGELIFYKEESNASTTDDFDYEILNTSKGEITIHIEDDTSSAPALNFRKGLDLLQSDDVTSKKQYSISFSSTNSEDNSYSKSYSGYDWLDADSISTSENVVSNKQIIIKDEEIKNLNLDTHYDYINFGILLDNIFVMDDFLIVDAIT